MTPLKVGVIGTGFAAKTLLPLLEDHRDEVAIVALCGGTDAQKTASIAAQYDIPLWTQDFRDVVNVPDLAVLFVASPHALHYESVHYASKQACHIICEKPLALTTAQVDELVSKNTDAKYLRLVSHQLRFHPTFLRIKALLADGGLGRPLYVTVRYETDRYITNGGQRRWWFEREQGGGMLLAVGTHLVDLIAYLFDETPEPIHLWSDTSAETMMSLGYPGTINAESMFRAALHLRPDILVDVFASGVSHAQGQGLQLHIRGTAGELYVGPTGELNCVRASLGDTTCDSHMVGIGQPVFPTAYRYYLSALIDLIRGRRNDLLAFPTFVTYRACHAVLEHLRKTE